MPATIKSNSKRKELSTVRRAPHHSENLSSLLFFSLEVPDSISFLFRCGIENAFEHVATHGDRRRTTLGRDKRMEKLLPKG